VWPPQLQSSLIKRIRPPLLFRLITLAKDAKTLRARLGIYAERIAAIRSGLRRLEVWRQNVAQRHMRINDWRSQCWEWKYRSIPLRIRRDLQYKFILI
jgi:hypothetical protein